MPQPFTLTESEGRCELLEDRTRPYGKVDYKYRLTGAHEGDPIDVWMFEVEDEVDEDGRHVIFDKLVWADDESPLDDDLAETYHEILMEDLAILARETWD